MITVIDSFDTINPPEPKSLFIDRTLTIKEQLSEDLQSVALKIVTICSIKVKEHGEDMEIETLKEVAKVAIDIQKAFFDNKQSNFTVNNVQNNISNTQLNHFKGIMQNEI